MNAARHRQRESLPIRFGDVIQPAAAVIFDKDGVLFDQFTLLAQLHNLRRVGVGVRYGEAVAQAYDHSDGAGVGASGIDVQGPLAMAVTEHETIVLAALLYRELRMPWLECLVEARAIFAEADHALDLTQIPPLPGFPEVLLRLKRAGVVVGIVTGDQRTRSLRQLAPFALDAVLDFLAAGDDGPYHKPDAQLLHFWLDQIAVPPAEAVLLGDSANDWIMAQRAGVHAVAVRPMTHPPASVLTTIDAIARISLALPDSSGSGPRRPDG